MSSEWQTKIFLKDQQVVAESYLAQELLQYSANVLEERRWTEGHGLH